MTREEQLQDLQFRAESLLRQHKANRELHCKIEGNRASELTAEYLMRPLEYPFQIDTEQMWRLHWADLNPYMRSVYLELKMAWLTSGSSKAEAERAAREAVGFENPPLFVSQPRHEDGPEYVEPIRFIAGWVVIAAIAALIFWGL